MAKDPIQGFIVPGKPSAAELDPSLLIELVLRNQFFFSPEEVLFEARSHVAQVGLETGIELNLLFLPLSCGNG